MGNGHRAYIEAQIEQNESFRYYIEEPFDWLRYRLYTWHWTSLEDGIKGFLRKFYGFKYCLRVIIYPYYNYFHPLDPEKKSTEEIAVQIHLTDFENGDIVYNVIGRATKTVGTEGDLVEMACEAALSAFPGYQTSSSK